MLNIKCLQKQPNGIMFSISCCRGAPNNVPDCSNFLSSFSSIAASLLLYRFQFSLQIFKFRIFCSFLIQSLHFSFTSFFLPMFFLLHDFHPPILACLLPFLFILTALVTLEGVNQCSSFSTFLFTF